MTNPLMKGQINSIKPVYVPSKSMEIYASLGIIDERVFRGGPVEMTCLDDLLKTWRGPSIKQIKHRDRQVSNAKLRKWSRHVITNAPTLAATYAILGMDKHAACMGEVLDHLSSE